MTRSIVHVAVLLSIAAACRAQPGAPPADVPNAQYTLSGTVVNSVTGEPVRRALVQIFMAGQTAMLTDASGHFEFSDLPAGETSINVRKPGFFNDQDLNAGQFGPPMAKVGPNASPVTVKIVPEGVIAGTIQSRDGEALENFPVRLIRVHVVNGHRQWEQTGNTNTNDNGEFRMGSLMPGLYYVVAGPGAETRWLGVPGHKGRRAAFPEVFYPGARDLNSATPIQLAPGQQAEANLSIAAEPVYRVSGTVEQVGENQGITLEFFNQAGDSVPVATEYGAEGKFEAKLPAGTYILKASAFGEGPPMTGSLSLTVNSDTSGVRVGLASVASIPVRTTFQSTRSTRPRTAGTSTAVMIHLNRAGGSFGNSDEWLSAGGTPDPAANRIHDLPPGRYSVEVTSQNTEWYVRSAQCGGTDLLRDDLVVVAGSRMPPIDIVLRDDGGRLGGTAVAGGYPSRAAVVAVPDAAPRMATMTYAGPDGRFNFGELAPGDYSVLAMDRADTLEYANPEAIAPYLAGATRVSVATNADAEVTVNVASVGR